MPAPNQPTSRAAIPANAPIAAKLREYADLLEQQDADSFRVSAYRHAADALMHLSRPVADIFASGGRDALIALPAVGRTIAVAIAEMVTTGRWAQRCLLLLSFALLAECGRAANKEEDQVELSSKAFEEGATIPGHYTCDGADFPPPLQWSAPPEGTRSFVVTVDDPDAPGGVFKHWAIFDIPAQSRSLDGGIRPAGTSPPQARNDFGMIGYGGPCPPRGHGQHRYRFRLFAIDVPHLEAGTNPKVADIERAIEGHVLASALLTGFYARQ